MLYTHSYAQTPNIITYQGKLTLQGTDVSGERTITARLYANVEGTEQVWEGTYKTYITDGIFALPLGAGKYPLPDPTKLDKQLWVGITIDGIELRPLTQLTSSPYALNVADKSITKAKLADDVFGALGNQDPQIWDNANGGTNNISSARMDFIGGGESNTITTTVPDTIGSWDIVGGGKYNKIDTLTEYNIIGGGKRNIINPNVSFASILGGDTNSISESFGSIGGGGFNRVKQGFGTIGGGYFNAVDSFSAIPGGRSLSLNKFSFGFNGDEKPTRSVDLATNGLGHIAYIGNVNTYLANTDNTARELRFYEPNSNTPVGDVFTVTDLGHYTAFKAQLQEVNITYQLPATDGQTGSVLTTDGYGSLYWEYLLDDDDDWQLTGNTSTVPGTNFLGTRDNQPLELRVFNQGVLGEGTGRVMRFEPNSTSANILGGYNGNKIISSVGSYIGSGGSLQDTNVINNGDFNVVVGGKNNVINTMQPGHYPNSYSYIGGGSGNLIDSYSAPQDVSYSTIVGGKNNYTLERGVFIGGGEENLADEDWAVVTGGIQNHARSEYTTVGGGIGNKVGLSHDEGIGSAILGGRSNIITGTYSIIGAGDSNFIGNCAFSTITGGNFNYINVLGSLSFIGGGGGYVSAQKGATTYNIRAGNLTKAQWTTIPGGVGLIAEGTAQTVIGHYNKTNGGTYPLKFIPGNDRLFIIGNGKMPPNDTIPTRSNAFEVSENGHSTVFHNNGNTNSAIVGTRYIDNTPIAYGYVDALGNLVPASSFASTAALGPAPNQVTITLNYTDPYTGAQVQLVGASITATIVGESCAFISTSTIAWVDTDADTIPDHNQFTISTSRLGFQGACDLVRLPFMFHVFGRP
jgi:hypothetical protein